MNKVTKLMEERDHILMGDGRGQVRGGRREVTDHGSHGKLEVTCEWKRVCDDDDDDDGSGNNNIYFGVMVIYS